MPIRVGASSITPVPPPVPAPRERLTMTWTAPDHTVMPLTDRSTGIWVMKGTIAFGAVPISITADANARGGETPRSFQYLKRLIILPTNVRGATRSEFIGRWRSAGWALTQTTELGPGLLTVTHPDGTSRMIQAYYQDGWQETQPEAGWMSDAAVVTLYCPDPWWLDTTETVAEWKYAAGESSPYLTNYPHVSSSRTRATQKVINPGEAGVWPQWQIDGPATGLTATIVNADGSESAFTLSATWDLGETVTIRTDPPEILGPDGSSWFDKITLPGVNLWPLPVGSSTVTIALSGTGTGSHVALRFFARRSTG